MELEKLEVAKNLAKFELMTCLTKQHDAKTIKRIFQELKKFILILYLAAELVKKIIKELITF